MEYITSRKTFFPLVCLLAILLSGPQLALAENETNSQTSNIHFFDDVLVDTSNLPHVTSPTGIVIPPSTRYDYGQFSAKRKIEKRISKIRIFGDSLVDTGNLPPVTWPFVIPPSTRYDRGRFSNSLVAVEHFSNRLKINLIPSINRVNLDDKGINWGNGGSTTAMSNINPGGLLVTGLLGQITEYEDALDAAGLSEEKTTKRKRGKKPLFIIWTAHNNYYIPLLTGTIPDENTVLEAVADISTAVTRLHARGAKLIVVANMINLGLPPICQVLPGDGTCDLLSDLTTDHNAALAEAMNKLETDLDKLKIIQFNVYEIFEHIFAYPNKYGFTETSLDEFGPASGCLLNPSPANCSLVDFRNGNIPWWDELHPSASIHEILGNALYGVIIKKLKH